MPQAAPLVAAEAAIATTMTAEAAAALAAEQAAAALAAEQAAAAAAAEQAAAMAAEQAAAQAATQATAQAAEQAVAQTTNTGIQTLAKEVTGTQATGIEQVFQNAQASNVPMSQAEFLNNSLAGANTPFNPAQPFANSTAIVTAPTPPVQTVLPAAPAAPAVAAPAAAAPAAPAAVAPVAPVAPVTPVAPVDYGFSSGLNQGVNAPLNTAQPSKYALGNQAGNYTLAQSVPSPAATATANPEPRGIEGLFNKGIDYVKQNPLTSLLGANALSGLLDKPKPKEEEKYKSTFDSSKYTGYQPVQPEPYKPQYAQGGLADLGGYSDGGRMLKGPGDGMSDDIPATIAGKQPARLANEEFVIPADVVSHLGNGSSEAGAKQLYKMMDRIRKARTGTKKQGKQINPEKYLA